ncbi:efflux RND transporter periplasmic adaptor subunit [bacterium]|nr:efflux RND transporter periplasmic adaptor subunit [bacterium]
MNFKQQSLLMIISTTLVLFISGCGGNKASGDSLAYKELMVEKGHFEIVVTANGTVEPIDRIQLKSKASGEIVELPVEQGDFVGKGDLIARLDQKDEKAAVAQAQADMDIAVADLEQAQKAYDRSEELYKQNLISEEEKDQIELNYATAKGRLVRATTTLERAKERFEESIVVAPLSGIILQKYVEEGQIIASGVSTVGGGSPIADIADMNSVYVKAGVDEIDIGKVKAGMEAIVIADAYPAETFRGNIIRISPEARVEQNVTLFDVTVEVANPQGKLKSGMNASIEIFIVKKEDALLVSAVALQTTPVPEENEGGMFGMSQNGRQNGSAQRAKARLPQGEASVLVRNGNIYESRQITIGLSNFQQIEILSGLKEGDVIGVPISSRVQQESDRFEQRIKSERSFGRQNAQQASTTTAR